MPMYNLIECSNNYSKESAIFWIYYRDEPTLTDDGGIENFPDNNAFFKFKAKITRKIPS